MQEMVKEYMERKPIGPGKPIAGSFAYLVDLIEEHLHVVSKVYPTLAPGQRLTSGPAMWALGDKTEIVPVNTITNDFDIHWVSIELITNIGVYELVLYKGLALAEIEIGRVRFAKTAVFESTLNIPMITPVIDANERISAALADDGGAGAIDISLFYHEYV